jgi:hypothetical protein
MYLFYYYNISNHLNNKSLLILINLIKEIQFCHFGTVIGVFNYSIFFVTSHKYQSKINLYTGLTIPHE